MDKNLFVELAQKFGFKVNADAVEEISANEMNKPDNWDQMSEEDQKAWKDKHSMSKNAADETPQKPEKTPAQPANKQNEQEPAPKPDEDLVWLNSLVKEMGGREAFKGLLLGAVNAVELAQNAQEKEKANVIASLVANSGGNLTEADLQDMELPALQKMAKVIVPAQFIDYRPLGATVKVNKDEIATMPDIYTLMSNSQEKGD